LCRDEFSQIVPLATGAGVDRVINQDGQKQTVGLLPIQNLFAFPALGKLNVVFSDRRRFLFLAHRCHGKSGGSRRRRGRLS
jgi:hypothetical protein